MTTKDKRLINKAFDFAYDAHAGQVDDSGKPYINHPVMVAKILMLVTTDINIIAAALLHDTIEDTPITYQDIEKEFGIDIAMLVNEVTHEMHPVTKEFYFPRLETQRGIMLKFADRLHNVSRMENWNQKRKNAYLRKSKFWKGGDE